MNAENLLDAIGAIDPQLVEAARTASAPQKRRFGWRGLALLAAALTLCLSAGLSALAASDYAPAYHLLYSISPAWAQKLKPVRASCLDNGILMEVLAADIRGDTAELLVGLKDLEDNRVDATVDLFDSYEVRSGFDSAATCRLDSYDEASGEAVFSILWETVNGAPVDGEKITFSVGQFLSHKQNWSGALTEIDLARVDSAAETAPLEPTRVRGGSTRKEAWRVLPTERNSICAPVAGATITGVGWADGQLHVQARYDRIHETDNHGMLWLQDAAGNMLEPDAVVSFWTEDRNDSCDELYFTVPREDLEGWTLWSDFVTCDQLVRGDWEVTFPLSAEE